MNRTLKLIFLGLAVGVLFLGAGIAYAQAGGYDLSWWSADGGGITSSGSNYILSGAIGQVEAGALSGGSYTLQGGFWTGGPHTNVTPPPGGHEVYLPAILSDQRNP